MITAEILESMEPEKFVIDSDTKAIWAIKKIREAKSETEQLVSFYKKQIEKAEAENKFRIDNLTAMLETYAETLPLKETKTQRSYSLPGAKLVFKKPHAVIQHDDERIIRALKDQGRTEFIKTVEKLDWASLKKAFTETGETVDGISIDYAPEAFDVRFEED